MALARAAMRTLVQIKEARQVCMNIARWSEFECGRPRESLRGNAVHHGQGVEFSHQLLLMEKMHRSIQASIERKDMGSRT